MALDERIRKLIKDGDQLFTERASIAAFWQSVAENFYPEMADFTSSNSGGQDFASHLTSSYPLLARRSLGDAFSALLRPVNLDSSSPGVWFNMRTQREKEDTEGRRWLEWATTIQRRAMYDAASGFTVATKMGDHMFAAFGQCPLSLELNRNRDTLLYRAHHLKDVAWCENGEGKIDHVQLKWNPTASQLSSVFRDKISPKVKEKLKDNPYDKIDCRHIMIAADSYEERDAKGNRYRTPWISIWVDVTNEHLMEEKGVRSKKWIIPRWQRVPGSQYAVSPAVVAALPDARLIQAMMLTMLEAAEKYADPPMVGVQEVIRSDVNLPAGGFTWIDAEYDERTGEAIRPLYQPQAGQGMNTAFAMFERVSETINKSFFLDSLSLPPAAVAKDMTAFEVGQRISEWIRRAMPIFEPMEFEYNAALCEETFDLLMYNGGFGNWKDIPQSIRRAEVQFKFESPLHESADRRKGQQFLEAKAMLLQAAELDQNVLPMLDARAELRTVLQSIGISQGSIRDDKEIDQLAQARQQEEAMQKTLAGAAGVAEIANNLGSAAKNFSAANAQPMAA